MSSLKKALHRFSGSHAKESSADSTSSTSTSPRQPRMSDDHTAQSRVPRSPKTNSGISPIFLPPTTHIPTSDGLAIQQEAVPPRKSSLENANTYRQHLEDQIRSKKVFPEARSSTDRRRSSDLGVTPHVGADSGKASSPKDGGKQIPSESNMSEDIFKPISKGCCNHKDHLKRTTAHREIKDGDSVTHRHPHLKPILHEKHHYHEVEEITKHVDREIHTHEYIIRELPILRPRRIVTRARIVVETQVLPDLPLGAEEPVIGDEFVEPMWETQPAIPSKCDEVGAYQAYAQSMHDRAVGMLAFQVSQTMLSFEDSLKSHPLPITSA